MFMFTWPLWTFSLGEQRPQLPGWTGLWPFFCTDQRQGPPSCVKHQVQTPYTTISASLSFFPFLCLGADQGVRGDVHSVRRTIPEVQRQTQTPYPVLSDPWGPQTSAGRPTGGATQSHQRQQVSWMIETDYDKIQRRFQKSIICLWEAQRLVQCRPYVTGIIHQLIKPSSHLLFNLMVHRYHFLPKWFQCWFGAGYIVTQGEC